jgi:3-deoxy-D-manno-octulosonic acid (KDO) 8-phosphate synthase
MDDLIQELATTEFWIELSYVIVFGGACFACYRAATKAERGGNKRRATILGIASIAILIAGLAIESHFGIFDDDGDSSLRGDHAGHRGGAVSSTRPIPNRGRSPNREPD